MCAVPFSGQEVIESRQKKSAELPLITICQPKMIFRDQLSKELLRQVLRFLRSVTFSAHIGVDGIPVGAAKRFQCALRAGGFSLSRRQHHAPARGREDARTCCIWFLG